MIFTVMRVNIAARLEPLTEPGYICLSQGARDALGKKLPLDYEDLGPQSLKNIAEPMRAYRIDIRLDAVMPEGSSAGHETVAARETHTLITQLKLNLTSIETAAVSAKKATELAPSYADAYAQSAAIFSNAGLQEQSLENLWTAKG